MEELSYDINDRNILKKLSGKGVVGFSNMGNTCYLNSVLQLLVNVKIFTVYIITDQYKKDVNNKRVKEQLFLESWVELLKSVMEEDEDSGCAVRPTRFKRVLSGLYSPFNNHDQHDALEAVNVILDLFHMALSYRVTININVKKSLDLLTDRERIELSSLNSWKAAFHSNYSVILNIFYGQFHSRVKCDECNYESSIFEAFNVLTLPIGSGCNTIDDCFNQFVLSDDISEWQCDKCKKRCSAKKKISVWRLPPVLFISLKRFTNDGHKIRRRIEFPLKNLVLEKICERYSDKFTQYNLIGVCNHSGHLSSGHYTAYCKNINGKWYNFNDESYEEMDEGSVVSNEAYILVYESKNIPITTIISE